MKAAKGAQKSEFTVNMHCFSIQSQTDGVTIPMNFICSKTHYKVPTLPQRSMSITKIPASRPPSRSRDDHVVDVPPQGCRARQAALHLMARESSTRVFLNRRQMFALFIIWANMIHCKQSCAMYAFSLTHDRVMHN